MKQDGKINLILGSHAHVPSGSPEKTFEYVYENVMRPFVSNLYRYSNIQAVLHYSGVLLYWVERTHPEFFMLIEDMVSRKQAEIIGGGFYEPMFPIIPLQDRIGQIELLTTYLRKHFGKRPLGAWIPAMAWEQNMAASLSASDIHYTFLSQDQFAMAGMKKNELFFPCITEDQGKLIAVFPAALNIEKELKEKSFSQVFLDLKKSTGRDNSCDIIVTIFPDKVYKDKSEAQDTAWNRFFEEISLSLNIAEPVLPSKLLKNLKVLKKASFPDSSAINGFSPRKLLIENCEAGGIYSKMIFTNVLISQLKGDRSRKQNAREELWKAQDSCLFSPVKGQYDHMLRKTAYSSLLRAEQMSREKGKFISSLIQYDFDLNGNKEFLIQDARLNCYIQLKGAGLFELDYLPKDWNYIDCGAAYPENGMDVRRVAFADVLLPPEINSSDLKNGYLEKAASENLSVRLCCNEQYDALTQDRKGKSCFKLIQNSGVPFGNIEINKCYLLKKDVLTVSHQLINNGEESCSFCFVSEINFSFAQEGNEFVRFFSVENNKDTLIDKDLKNVSSLKILDISNEVQILLDSANAFSGCIVNHCPEKQYQTTRILPLFHITLESGKSWTNEFGLKFSH